MSVLLAKPQFVFDEPDTTRYNAAFPGQLAQLVEQRIENPRVRGSIPRLATRISKGLTVRSGPFRLVTVPEM